MGRDTRMTAHLSPDSDMNTKVNRGQLRVPVTTGHVVVTIPLSKVQISSTGSSSLSLAASSSLILLSGVVLSEEAS